MWHLEIDYEPLKHDLTKSPLIEKPEEDTSPISSVPLFLTLALSLNSDNTPDMSVVISHDCDCTQPLNSLEYESCGIDLRIGHPIAGYSFPDVYLQEVQALCDHLDINVTLDLLPWLEKEFGAPAIHPDPALPPGWDRDISTDGNSYFINRETGEQSMEIPATKGGGSEPSNSEGVVPPPFFSPKV